MEKVTVHSGNLRAIGYDSRLRTLQVDLENGVTLEYSGVGEELWRRFRHASSAWSFYRDQIEEEYTSRRVSSKPSSGQNPLDQLFRKS
ncbi:MAG: KTSC domain-containing protein [Betaproteobacteria bacterium]|nr:KTSC domain-containing protein [Betaproteobacteria bacterium]MDE2622896.1 KTSC domain-containing protein [Betaproteobacteria bacterium]